MSPSISALHYRYILLNPRAKNKQTEKKQKKPIYTVYVNYTLIDAAPQNNTNNNNKKKC